MLVNVCPLYVFCYSVTHSELATTAKTLHSYVCLNLPAVYQSIELLVNSINDTLGNRGPKLSRVDSDCPLGMATLSHGPALAQGLVDSLLPLFTPHHVDTYTHSQHHTDPSQIDHLLHFSFRLNHWSCFTTILCRLTRVSTPIATIHDTRHTTPKLVTSLNACLPHLALLCLSS